MASPTQFISQLQQDVNKQILGQQELIESLLIGLICEGNLLLEGLPGLAKTRAVKALAKSLSVNMNRIQFTPDLLPSDITGTEIFNPNSKDDTFEFKPGPIFCNLVLADEINRAPAKVQSALLEAMEEHQVTVGNKTYKMDPLFMVIATQNPIEQEGTYPLPEAQLDRFMIKVNISYLTPALEKQMLKLVRGEETSTIAIKPLNTDPIFELRKQLNTLTLSDEVEDYIIRLVFATREDYEYNKEVREFIDVGVSPRASIALDKASRCVALMNGRDYVTPDDVRHVAHRVIAHRLVLSFKASSQKISDHDVVSKLLDAVPVS